VQDPDFVCTLQSTVFTGHFNYFEILVYKVRCISFSEANSVP